MNILALFLVYRTRIRQKRDAYITFANCVVVFTMMLTALGFVLVMIGGWAHGMGTEIFLSASYQTFNLFGLIIAFACYNRGYLRALLDQVLNGKKMAPKYDVFLTQ